MRNHNRPSPNPNQTPPTTPLEATPNPSFRDLETMGMGEFLKAKISHSMGRRATARAEKMVDARLDLVEQQEAAGLPVHDSQGMFRRDNRDALVAQYVTDKDNERKYKKEKRKYVLSRIGSAAMWVPGVNIVGSMVSEAYASHKVHKKMASEYRSKNGTVIGRAAKIHRSNQERHAKQKQIVDDFGELLAAGRARW